MRCLFFLLFVYIACVLAASTQGSRRVWGWELESEREALGLFLVYCGFLGSGRAWLVGWLTGRPELY